MVQHFGPHKVVGPHVMGGSLGLGPHKCRKTRPHTHTHVEGGNSALITDVQTTAQFVLTRMNRRTEKTRCPGCCSQRGRSSVNTDSTV